MTPVRKIALVFACVLLWFRAAASGQADSVAFRTESLVKLCEVWSEVKFSDPRLLYREVDWDGALVRAIPKVREARTQEQRAQAIGSMLAELSDPVTRVFHRNPPQPGSAPVPLLRWDGDLLVVNLGPYMDSVSDEALFYGLGQQIDAELSKAKSVVFDLRAQRAESPGLVLDDLTLVSEQVAVPAWRRVFHSGYAPPSGATAGYYSALQVVAASPLPDSGGKGSLPARYVFLVGDELPEQVAALWWSGHAAIVAETPLSEDWIARTRKIDLGDGWFAAVRVRETIVQGILADAVVAPGGKDDAPMVKALALARDPSPLPERPAPRLTATAPIVQNDADYADMRQPDLPYRLLGLFRLWAVIDRFYPFENRLGDWEAVLAEFIPRFEQANDAGGYAQAVLEIVARLEDGHAIAWGPAALWDIVGARLLPLEIRSIEGRFIVTGKMEALAKDAPIAIGDEIVSIDGEPLADRVRRLRKYFGASTEAARTAKVLFYAVRGPVGSVAELVVRGADGKDRTVKVERTHHVPELVREGEIWRVLDGNIGYVDLTRLTVDQVEEMFTALKGTDAILFDMRGYPNGTGWSIAPRLNTNQATAGAIFLRPELAPSDTVEARTRFSFEQPLPKTDQEIYRKPTVMLIDERAVSQAEWTGLLFEAANGTKFIGTNSAGAVGDRTELVLPGGIHITFTGHDVRHADGRPVQGIGLVPDVRVEPTVAGIRAGRDEVLERALAYLRQSLH